MHKPDVKELGELSHSALLLYEWMAYREYVSKFYGPGATKIIIVVQDDYDSEIGTTYAVAEVKVFAGEIKMEPDINRVNLECPDPLFQLGDDPEGIMEFLDDFVADLPVPFTIGNLVENLEAEVDITQMPEVAKMAQRIWLED